MDGAWGATGSILGWCPVSGRFPRCEHHLKCSTVLWSWAESLRGSLGSPASTEDASTTCRVVELSCCAWAQSPCWPILSRSRAVAGAQCPSCWLSCTSSVGGPSLPLSLHNSSSLAPVKEPGQEAPSRSAQWHSSFLPARLGACAGRGYLCLPVWVTGDSFPSEAPLIWLLHPLGTSAHNRSYCVLSESKFICSRGLSLGSCPASGPSCLLLISECVPWTRQCSLQ